MSQDFLEILKYTLPSVVVFVTVYFLLKTYLSHMFKLEVQKQRRDSNKAVSYTHLDVYKRQILYFINFGHDDRFMYLGG